MVLLCTPTCHAVNRQLTTRSYKVTQCIGESPCAPTVSHRRLIMRSYSVTKCIDGSSCAPTVWHRTLVAHHALLQFCEFGLPRLQRFLHILAVFLSFSALSIFDVNLLWNQHFKLKTVAINAWNAVTYMYVLIHVYMYIHVHPIVNGVWTRANTYCTSVMAYTLTRRKSANSSSRLLESSARRSTALLSSFICLEPHFMAEKSACWWYMESLLTLYNYGYHWLVVYPRGFSITCMLVL